MKTEVSIVIPALNEEKGIGGVLDDIGEVMAKEKIRYEIIVVDDGSTDGTGEIAKVKKAIVIRHPQNAGYGAALKTGMRVARYENIAITDADGTYPVNKIPDLLKFTDEGFDLVIGARTGRFYRYIWFKQPVRYIFKLISEFVSGTEIPDPNSGFRIYRRSTILPFLNSGICRGFSFSTSTTLIFILEGKFVKFFPIEYCARRGKSKIKFFRDALRASQILAETIMYYNPLKLFLMIVLFFIFFDLVFLVTYLLTKKILFLVLFSLFFLSAVNSLFLGFISVTFKKSNK